MQEQEDNPEWHVIGCKVIGASHKRLGLPNQDAIDWLPESGPSSWLILAVADGHGSAKYFRSDEGARLAVEAAIQEMHTLLEEQEQLANPLASKPLIEEHLQHLVHTWKNKVEADVHAKPFAAEEWQRLVQEENNAALALVKANPILAYGATILTVMVTARCIIYLQLGDGDILTVSQAGKVSRPLPRDKRLFANETTSIAAHHAWRDIHYRIQELSQDSPALILLSTDGYANSFRNEKEFLKVGSDFLEMLRLDGPQEVNAHLEGWLNEATQSGSGDDIALGLLYHTDALQAETPQAESTKGRTVRVESPTKTLVLSAQQEPTQENIGGED